MAREFAEDIGGRFFEHSDALIFDSRPDVVAHITAVDFDVGLVSPFLLQSRRFMVWATVEGVPVLSERTKHLLSDGLVYAVSEYAASKMREAGVRVDGVLRYRVRRSCVDYGEAARLRRECGGAKICVGWLGANQERKGLDILGKVAKKMNDMSMEEYHFLVVTGDGDYDLSRLERLPNVTVLREVYNIKHIYSFFHAIDVFLSTSRAEGFGLPVAEALLAGVPVVAPALPVYRELYDGLAYLVPVSGPRRVNYKGMMWMEYFEPDVDELVAGIVKVSEYDRLERYRLMEEACERFYCNDTDYYQRFLDGVMPVWM